jgi:hypothetical protein
VEIVVGHQREELQMRTSMIATSMIGLAVLAAGAATPASAGPQYYGSSGGTIRCESNDGRTRECATGGGRVVLERQISNSACIEGRSWGYGRVGIWVSQGCRADFRVVGYGGNYGGQGGNRYGNDHGQLVRCESNDGRSRTCPMDTRGGVQLVRQLSNAACIEGRNWRATRIGVWVTDGCRADFGSGGGYGGYRNGGYGNGGYYGNNHGIGGQLFRCESNDGRTRECAANTRAGVQLVRVLSNAPCIQGRSWGYGRNGIWVSQGCRAEFRAY